MKATMQVDRGSRRSLIFRHATWAFYDMFTDQLGERPTRVSFDGDTLEMAMTLSFEHEGMKKLLASMVAVITEEFEIHTVSGGSTTLKFKDKKKGLEPDECFWVQNAAAMKGVKRLNLKIHPVPDLVVEVDVMHSVVNREEIYASMGVPELWNYGRSTGFTAWKSDGGHWARIERSLAFPMIDLSELGRGVSRFAAGEDQHEIIREFRGSIRRGKALRRRSRN